jgi:hypothetical protein
MGDVMHTRVMLCNAAVQKYHNFRIQLDFFLFFKFFASNLFKREASRNHSKTPLQLIHIVEKNHFNVVDWHCVFNVVDLPWELKEKKNKKKKYMGHLALASRTVTKQNIGL